MGEEELERLRLDESTQSISFMTENIPKKEDVFTMSCKTLEQSRATTLLDTINDYINCCDLDTSSSNEKKSKAVEQNGEDSETTEKELDKSKGYLPDNAEEVENFDNKLATTKDIQSAVDSAVENSRCEDTEEIGDDNKGNERENKIHNFGNLQLPRTFQNS
ncbi:hypothetical protein FQA39_LY18735 [Lamprigera yunnana]|nr:hypothetical protein FQA39_LY18735 [Lamprigera yunnana]